MRTKALTRSGNSTLSLINRRQFLQCLGGGGASLLLSVVGHPVSANYRQNGNTELNPNSTPLQNFEFETVRVNAQGRITAKARRIAQHFVENLGNGVTLEMVAIPGGAFIMGSPESEPGRSADESPQRNVTLKPFFIGKYEITQAQYQTIMGNNPAIFKGENRPVEQISWDDAVEFCKKLSNITGRNYRLPSEAEWEYACRAGTNTPFHFGETITAELANYDASQTYASAPQGLFRRQTTPVGSFPANAFGLYDMHGNVLEWCQDGWHDNYHGAPVDGSVWINENDNRIGMLRGGFLSFSPIHCRSAARYSYYRDERVNYFGFRVVCDGEEARTTESQKHH
ncbi:formylglycine-generating enzyme family protein [Aliinostoc sp. HNIBRCY26]|uniref:formylglycine-generating enzyme family protein n=1 Tax=Aliinostoc sp. HNIBRCY26 TaxID=3418997 RepID=UPI003CFFBBD0